MTSIPLRIRITLLVVATAALMVVIIIGSGALDQVDENIALDSLESAGEALETTDGELIRYGEDLKRRIADWAVVNEGGAFEDWRANDVPASISIVDVGGNSVPLEAVGAVEISSTVSCRASPGNIDCGSDSEGIDIGFWARRSVENRADLVSEGGPVVVHGFVVAGRTVEDSAEVLVRYEADPLLGADSDFSSGFFDIALVAIPLLLLGLGAVTWFSLGRALNPVASMIDQVEGIGADSLDQRVAVPAADDELKHLANTMNRMLDRLQGANDRQRQFISDASHELRSPITATSATLEVARARPDEADWEQVAAVVDEENNRLASLVDDLLLLARMDEDAGAASGGTSAERYAWAVDLDEICLAEAGRPHPVEVSVRVIEPARVVGNTATLTRAIRNLVDNATAHAKSAVWLEVDAQDHEAIVRVCDDGPGVPADYAEEIFERFVRVDESRVRNDHRSPMNHRSKNNGGAGLGLAIARRVAQNHGGRLELMDSQGPGAVFELSLPLAD